MYFYARDFYLVLIFSWQKILLASKQLFSTLKAIGKTTIGFFKPNVMNVHKKIIEENLSDHLISKKAKKIYWT